MEQAWRREGALCRTERVATTAGDEAIHCVLDMMYARAPYTVMQRAMHIHPTVSDGKPSGVQVKRILGNGDLWEDILSLQDGGGV